MAVFWSFAYLVLLLLTLVAPGQPLFQPPPAGTRHKHARENSKAAVENHHTNSLAVPHVSSEDVRRSWNVLVGRRGRFRRLLERGAEFMCDERLNCRRRVDPERARTREILENYRLPQQLQPTHFQSERMVPTGPNPLHNSNRSQVIFP